MRNNGKKRVISEEDTSGEQKEKHIAKYQPKKRSSNRLVSELGSKKLIVRGDNQGWG